MPRLRRSPVSRSKFARAKRPSQRTGRWWRFGSHAACEAAMKTIEEPGRQIPLYGEYEVAVLGGGPPGIAAAVAAARAGRRQLLIERFGFLGGMGTAAGVTNFCGL